ncbi:VOC family protein [Dyella koreensis]|uniref:Uncharacterized protein n=1 Tax=Dyella koreensis TaxID=311235 RepID=A0ABW8K285_9GAMM
MAQAITTFLMHEGVAKQAMQFDVSLFGRLEIYSPDETGPESAMRQTNLTRRMAVFRHPDSNGFNR